MEPETVDEIESEPELDENGNYIKAVPVSTAVAMSPEPSCSDGGSSHAAKLAVPQCLASIETYNTLVDTYKRINKKVTGLETEWTAFNNRIDFKMKQLNQLVSLRSRRVDLFGEKMATLTNLIDKSGYLFKRLPTGPLGSCISVRSPSWIPLIECILYPYLFIFLVDNRHDYNVLVKMIDKVFDNNPGVTPVGGGQCASPLPVLDAKRKPDVWITRYTAKKRNLSDVRVPIGFGYTTLMDMLEIHGKDPDVFNALHDFTNFDKVVLFNNEHDAFLRMGDSFRLPRNAKIGYTKNFLKVTPYPHFRTISLYNYATTLRNAPWKCTPAPHQFQPSIASSKVIRDRLRVCQRGAKSLSTFIEPSRPHPLTHAQPQSRRSRSSLPPNTITLHSGEIFDLDKASNFYLLPSLKPTIRTLRQEIQSLCMDRNIHKMILKLNRETRLDILSQLEMVKEQLKKN